MKKTFISLAMLIASFCATAQNTSFWDGLVKNADWNRPFWADMHSTLTRAEVAIARNSPEYDWADKGGVYRPYVFSNLGTDLPVWSGNFNDGKYGLKVTLPFMIDVWLDMFERTTAPVINTAYRFGAPEFSFIHRLPSSRWLHNYVIQFSPMKHECTHLGDELTIKRKLAGLPLTRINVSYNYAELAFTLNDPDGSLRQNYSFRAGALLLHNPSHGWYDILPEEGEVSKVVPSKYPYEIYLQCQYQMGTSARGFQGIASTEFRNRSKYGYPQYYMATDEGWLDYEVDEFRSWCWNMFIGVRYNNMKHNNYFSRCGVGLRFYNGINPYGQFRSHIAFQQLGLALIFE